MFRKTKLNCVVTLGGFLLILQVLNLQTSPARNGKLDGKGGGNKGIDGWEETVMGSGVSSVRFIWCGAVLWRYGDTYVKRSR